MKLSRDSFSRFGGLAPNGAHQNKNNTTQMTEKIEFRKNCSIWQNHTSIESLCRDKFNDVEFFKIGPFVTELSLSEDFDHASVTRTKLAVESLFFIRFWAFGTQNVRLVTLYRITMVLSLPGK